MRVRFTMTRDDGSVIAESIHELADEDAEKCFGPQDVSRLVLTDPVTTDDEISFNYTWDHP